MMIIKYLDSNRSTFCGTVYSSHHEQKNTNYCDNDHMCMYFQVYCWGNSIWSHLKKKKIPEVVETTVFVAGLGTVRVINRNMA